MERPRDTLVLPCAHFQFCRVCLREGGGQTRSPGNISPQAELKNAPAAEASNVIRKELHMFNRN
eukprot:1179490-Prorocentrum_minimum.AAC.1